MDAPATKACLSYFEIETTGSGCQRQLQRLQEQWRKFVATCCTHKRTLPLGASIYFPTAETRVMLAQSRSVLRLGVAYNCVSLEEVAMIVVIVVAVPLYSWKVLCHIYLGPTLAALSVLQS